MPAVEGRLQIEYVRPDALRPFAGNPRKISLRGLEKLQRSVEEFGFINPIIAQRGSRMVIAGHQRLKAAQAAGLTEVPVVWLDVDDVTAKAYNLADNRLQQESEWDFAPLADLLQELDTGAIDLTLTGFDEDELRRMMEWAPEPEPGELVEDEAPEPPEEPVTKPGDLWILGRHRLLCGDSTRADDVGRLLAGATPLLMVTDPPYGVNYSPEWRNEALGEGNRSIGKVANDDRADWREAWALFAGDVAYVWHAASKAWEVAGSLFDCGFEVRAQIVWAKQHFVISRGHYHYQHEPCWYAVRKGRTAHWCGDRKQSTLWQINNGLLQGGPRKAEDAITGHGTQKPVEAMARPMRNHDVAEVYEPFCGSGTTVIAAEQLGRRCYAMEIDPRYCDVIVERWERLTGQKARLER